MGEKEADGKTAAIATIRQSVRFLFLLSRHPDLVPASARPIAVSEATVFTANDGRPARRFIMVGLQLQPPALRPEISEFTQAGLADTLRMTGFDSADTNR